MVSQKKIVFFWMSFFFSQHLVFRQVWISGAEPSTWLCYAALYNFLSKWCTFRYRPCLTKGISILWQKHYQFSIQKKNIVQHKQKKCLNKRKIKSWNKIWTNIQQKKQMFEQTNHGWHKKTPIFNQQKGKWFSKKNKSSKKQHK